MQDLNDKATGNALTAAEWNQLPSEVQNVIEALGIVLSGADVNQLGKAIAGYAANGTFYTDSGIADAYTLAQVGSKQAPTAYTNGMEVSFLPGNANTGASTVNVSGLGVKDIRDAAGGVLAAGVLITTQPIALVYNSGSGHFRTRSAAFADMQTSLIDATAGRVMRVGAAELLARTAPQKTTHNMTSDANYTLTAGQELYGRIIITDTGVLLTAGRSIICSTTERGYFITNNTLQTLTFKTAAGTGVAVLPNGGGAYLVCDGTNVVDPTPSATATAVNLTTRQTVLAGGVDANGQANFLNAGTGLAVDMDATAVPVVLALANGFNSAGGEDFIGQYSADMADYWSGLAANNLSYLFVDRAAGTGVLSAYKSLVPPQYGSAFVPHTNQSLLHFEGSDASTTITDDYGSTWTAAGNAQIDTAQFKFGSSSLLLDGTGDYISKDIPDLGNESWQVEGWVRFTTLPGPAAFQHFLTAENAGTFGIRFALLNTAGVYSHRVYLSSTGGAWDIASAVTANIATPSTGVWYHWAFGRDKVSGKYYSSWEGVKALDITSALAVCPVTSFRLGIGSGGTDGIIGHLDEIRMSQFCRYSGGTTFTPSATAFVPDAEWFDLSSFKWKYGSPVSWTEKQRVCVGEATTGAATVSSAVTYALRGEYTSGLTTITASAAHSFNHYIGVQPKNISVSLVNYLTQSLYVPGDEVKSFVTQHNSTTPAGFTPFANRTNLQVATTTQMSLNPKGGGSPDFITFTSWKMKVNAQRGW